jgi:hypothetical protein
MIRVSCWCEYMRRLVVCQVRGFNGRKKNLCVLPGKGDQAGRVALRAKINE